MDQDQPSPIESAADDTPLVTLFRHNLWANLRLLDICDALDEGHKAATTVGTYGALYDTVHHIFRSEQWYLSLLTGRQPETRLRGEDSPSLDVLRAQAHLSGEGLIAYAATAPSGVVVVEFSNGYRQEFPAAAIVTQAINHATEHRAQVMTILTQQGIEPPELDAWAYVEAHAMPPATE